MPRSSPGPVIGIVFLLAIVVIVIFAGVLLFGKFYVPPGLNR